jgi:hypothetical protein
MVYQKPPPGPLLSPDHKVLGGAHQQSAGGAGAHSYLWVGIVIHVDTETMVCSVRLETGNGERHDVPIPAAGGGGPRSWAGCIIEPGSKVLLGWKKYDHRAFVPYIVQVLTVGIYSAREYEPFSTIDPADVETALTLHPELAFDPHVNLTPLRLKARKAYPGDFLASAREGADIILDRDSYLTNRAGNEFRLRDSDQTAILQTVNEFVNNSAGYYRRGLIKRNAFNLLPDLFISGQPVPGQVDDQDLSAFLSANTVEVKDVTSTGGDTIPVTTVSKVSNGSPAYNNLLGFGLINVDGTTTFPNDPTDPLYPFVVTPDGQRISYIVHGEKDFSFSQTDQCYVEDRIELRHTHDGIMAVTEEGDGVQIDPVQPVFIEDVKGTIVGNDAYTNAGRALYKQILTMRVFDSPDDGAPSSGPKFEPVNVITSQTEADTKALARLFRIQSPTNSNQFVFGVTKEGRLFVHIPKTQTGTTQDKGKSADINIVGLVKAILGSDENTRTSLDFTTQGGVKLDIGAFKNEDPNDAEIIAADITLHGKIRINYVGQQGRENIIQGSDFRSMTGSALDVIGGNNVRSVGGSEAVEAMSVTHNAGFGGYKIKTAGDFNQSVLGKTSELYAQPRISTFALADTKTMLAGIDSQTVLVGGIARTVAAGTGITDTVGAGNYAVSVGTGNYAASVGVGSLAATVGAGAIAFTAGAGSATLTGSVSVAMVSATIAMVTAPLVKLGLTVVGFAVAGIPGPPGPHIDYITGLPILGVPTVTLG